MKKGRQLLTSEDGDIHVSCEFDYEIWPEQYEDFHGPKVIPGGVSIWLTAVNVVIGGRAINIMPLLHPGEKENIINQIKTEEL